MASHPTPMPLAVRSHPGVTLLELLVVLALLGVGAAAVAPALRLPAPRSGDGDPVARTRALALRRAETLVLAIDADGRWTAHPARDSGLDALASGTVPRPRADSLPSRLVVTPLGDCLADVGVTAALAWDPVRCAPAGAGAAR